MLKNAVRAYPNIAQVVAGPVGRSHIKDALKEYPFFKQDMQIVGEYCRLFKNGQPYRQTLTTLQDVSAQFNAAIN